MRTRHRDRTRWTDSSPTWPMSTNWRHPSAMHLNSDHDRDRLQWSFDHLPIVAANIVTLGRQHCLRQSTPRPFPHHKHLHGGVKLGGSSFSWPTSTDPRLVVHGRMDTDDDDGLRIAIEHRQRPVQALSHRSLQVQCPTAHGHRRLGYDVFVVVLVVLRCWVNDRPVTDPVVGRFRRAASAAIAVEHLVVFGSAVYETLVDWH